MHKIQIERFALLCVSLFLASNLLTTLEDDSTPESDSAKRLRTALRDYITEHANALP